MADKVPAEATEPTKDKADQGAELTPHAGLMGLFGRYAERKDLPPAFHVLLVLAATFVTAVAVGPRDWQAMLISAGLVVVVFLLFALAVVRVERKGTKRAAEAGRLAGFLGLPPQGGRVGVFTPVHLVDHDPEQGEPYHVRSVAMSHVQAIVELVSLLSEVDVEREEASFEPSSLFVSEEAVDRFRGSPLFLVGGPLPNRYVAGLVEEDPHLALEDDGREIRLRCTGLAEAFSILPPRGDRTIEQVERATTYGVVQKASVGSRTVFALWGLDSRGTIGAARWLATRWAMAEEEFGVADFKAILRFLPGRTGSADRVVRHPDSRCNVLVPA